jgi:hypothetical protein
MRRRPRKPYASPSVVSDHAFTGWALSCGKFASPPPGSHHFYSAYDTFTGHLGPGFGASSSQTGSAGVGFGPGGTSQSYNFSGLCINWVTLST